MPILSQSHTRRQTRKPQGLGAELFAMFADAHKPLPVIELGTAPDGAKPQTARITYDVNPTPDMLAHYSEADRRGVNGV